MHDLTAVPPGRTPRARHKLVAAVVSLVSIGALSIGVAASASAAGPRRDAVSEARHATRQFHNLSATDTAGYKEFTDVNGITCINGRPSQGNMGVHFVNGDLVDGTVNIDQPEAIIYEHTPSGLQLTAVEYIVPVEAWTGAQPPELFGHEFMRIAAPNRFGLPDFYALHAWIWKGNPTGTYMPWNPDVKCPPAM